MSNHAEQARSLFLSALDKYSPEQWPAFLDGACRDDVALRERVEQLLQAHVEMGSIHTSAQAPTIDHVPLERLGTQIGPYKLHQEIGEGGMGVVYMALQKEPVRRKVALKIIKPGMDTREVIARFAAEEQALAMMDHPNIARVFDAGTTETGRPYFVMELVNGVPITEYCDDNHSTTRQRLELFTLVCHAVQHAHQKGIIHRDLKPSNILVTLHDGVPVPKVIDFGIAKAINQELTSKTMATGVGHMIGTPLYMSPEQAERSGLDIDTRSDIYSLGVLLYELLTGSTPFERGTLKDLGLDELRRVIREQEPPRPSTRISTMGQAATTVSEHRRTNPVELSNSLRNELDWIVMKALEKDRTRRYESANDFARDIQRYLNDEAVEACPPSTAYRLKKFVRRNRTAVLSIAAIGLALILGAGVAGGQAYRATKAEKYAEEQMQIAQKQESLAKRQTQLAKKQEKLAQEAAQRERDLRTEAEHQRDLAQKATQEADAARKQSEAVTNFLVDIFRSPDPERDGRTITVAEMLDKAISHIEMDFSDNRVLEAQLLSVVGMTYDSLGLWNESAELYLKSYGIAREVLGPEHPNTLTTRYNLGCVFWRLNKLEQSIPLFEETLAIRRRVSGDADAQTLRVMVDLGENYTSARRLDEAVSVLEEAVERSQRTLGPEHLITLSATSALAGALTDAGRPDDGLPLLEKALRQVKEKLGPEHPNTVYVENCLSFCYQRSNRPESARRLLEEMLPWRRETLGAKHPETQKSMNNLAVAYLREGRPDQAVPLLEEVVGIREKTLGSEHPDTLTSVTNLASSFLEVGRILEAVRQLETARQIATGKFGNDHPATLHILVNLAKGYSLAGRYQEAIELNEMTLDLARKVFGADHPDTLRLMCYLAETYRKANQHEAAIRLASDTLELARKTLPLDHPLTFSAKGILGAALSDAGREDEAIKSLEETVECLRKVVGPKQRQTLVALQFLADAYSHTSQVDRAATLLTDVVLGRQEILGMEHPKTLEAKILLGNVQVQRGEYGAAESLLSEAYEGFVKRQAAGSTPYDDQQVLAALTSLVQLYEKSSQPDKAKEWQVKLDALKSAAKPESKEN